MAAAGRITMSCGDVSNSKVSIQAHSSSHSYLTINYSLIHVVYMPTGALDIATALLNAQNDDIDLEEILQRPFFVDLTVSSCPDFGATVLPGT